MAPVPPSPLPLSVVTAADPVVRDAAIASLVLGSPGTVVVRHDLLPRDGALRRVVLDATGVVEDETVPLAHACVTCSMREDAVPTLARLAGSGRWTDLVLALSPTAPPLPVARALVAMARPGGELDGLRLASTAAAVDLDALEEDLLGDATVDECGLALADDDERPVGEALAGLLEQADLVVATGDSATGSGLVDRLRGADSRRLDGLFGLSASDLAAGRHDLDAAERRAHSLDGPRAAAPAGVPGDRSWTLVLESPRPFHPERLLDRIEDLGRGRIRSRGVFHVPDRPDSMCAWDGAGNQLCVADLGTWDDEAGGREPRTRIVVVGAGDEGAARAERRRLRDAFAAVLASDAECADGGLAWLGRQDVLAPWLGARAVDRAADAPW